MLRFAHLASAAPALDLVTDGTTLFSDVGYQDVTEYVPVNPATYTLRLRSAGTGGVVLTAPNATLTSGRFYTVYAVGMPGSGAPPLQVLIPLDGNSYLNLDVLQVAVVGRDGRLLFGPADLNAGNITNPLAARAARGLSYTLSSRYPGVVDSIAGQRNEDQAGWEYAVNSEVSSLAASSRTLGRNDRLIWWYSAGHGSPVPAWESLG
jgi:hypothetical protein